MRREEIDADLAARLVADRFPQWAGLPVREVELNGWDNRTFRLGDELSVRLPAGDWYAKQVEKEHRWLSWLAPQLPLPIPAPVARGEPALGFPWPWSVYRWLEGAPAAASGVGDEVAFAVALARFLVALGRVDTDGGPTPGEHNFFRGAHVSVYEDEVLEAVERLEAFPREAVMRAWEDAVSTSWEREPVWLHGDVAVGNLLVCDGALSAVIDFGCAGVGDPACDVVIAWTLFDGPSRDAFRRELGVDAGTWSRGRGWALWKALITLPDPRARRDIERVLADYASS